jgi:RNA polymerase sigma-70 factor (ECF subfamily)
MGGALRSLHRPLLDDSMIENSSNPMRASERSPNRDLDHPQTVSDSHEIIPAAKDELLLERVRANDQKAMTDIFDRYGSLVYSVSLRVLKDPGQAEDVMQEIFFQLWKNPNTFVQGRGSLGAWLAVVARNRAIDFLRRRKPTDSVDEVVLVSKTNISSEIERNIMVEKIRELMKSLPSEQQKSVELAFFEGLSHAEVAAKTGDPLGTVKTRIRLALISLRKAIQA